jgi:ribonuclease Z
MKFELSIIGSNSATPAFGRNQSSQILNINETLYLIDCGEGTQLQLNKFGIKKNKISYIFISHLHGDHYLGLVGLLSSMHLSGRKEQISVFGPPELKELIDLHLKYSQSELRYPLHFYPTQSTTENLIFKNKEVKVYSFPLDHRIPCTGFRFNEIEGLPRMNKEKIEGLEIPPIYFPLIKQGECYQSADGQVYSSEDLTIPARRPRSYAYCSDTLYSETYFPFIINVDLLYHEATFMQDMLERAIETHHSTAIQAAEVAKDVHAKKLIIGHFSARYRNLDPVLAEAKSIFKETYLAIEGSEFGIEYADDD